MLAAFGGSLKESVLLPRLEREDAVDAYQELRALAASGEAITDEKLRALLEQLHSRPVD